MTLVYEYCEKPECWSVCALFMGEGSFQWSSWNMEPEPLKLQLVYYAVHLHVYVYKAFSCLKSVRFHEASVYHLLYIGSHHDMYIHVYTCMCMYMCIYTRVCSFLSQQGLIHGDSKALTDEQRVEKKRFVHYNSVSLTLWTHTCTRTRTRTRTRTHTDWKQWKCVSSTIKRYRE